MSDPTLPKTSAGPGLAIIADELFTRRMTQLPIAENQRVISAHYGNRVPIPLPEMDAEERPAVANLIAQAIDQHSLRVASGHAVLTVAASDPSKKAALAKARAQRSILLSWDDQQERELFDRRWARWLTAWGQAPTVVKPDAKLQQPVWELRNPLGCYPNPLRRYDDMRPIDVINTFERTYQWLKNEYPTLDSLLRLGNRKTPYRNDMRFEVVEYINDEVIVTGILGIGEVPPFALLANAGFVAFPIPRVSGGNGTTFAIELERVPNLAETCTAVTPGRITLDVLKGLVDDVVGIYQMNSKLLALHVNAVARGIYPDDWFVETNPNAEIVQVADGLKGIVGHVRGGTMVQHASNPGVQTMQLVEVLNDNARINGSAPQEWSGNSPTNVRTALRGSNVMSGAVEFPIQEHQLIMARARRHEYEIAMRVDRAYFKTKQKAYFTDLGFSKGQETYRPGDMWNPIPQIRVKFPYAGMDENAIAMVDGQKLNEGLISRATIMERDRSIDDPEAERGRISAERAVATFEAFLDQQIQTGALAGVDLARYTALMRKGGLEPEEAYEQVHKEAQLRQASSGPPGTPAGPVPPGSPEAQLGAQAGPGGAAPPTTMPPNPSQVNLKALLGALGAGR